MIGADATADEATIFLRSEIARTEEALQKARDLHVALKILEAQGTPDREAALQRRDDVIANTAARVFYEAKLAALTGGRS